MQLAKDSDVLKIIRKFKRLNAIDRVNKGHLCFLATLHGDIVHYKWVAFNEFYVFGMKCRISPNSAYVYDAYTASEYRGLGISSKMTTNIFDYLRQKGTKKAFACVVYNNFPSLRVMQKLGYRKMGEITIIRILSKLWIKKYQGETQEDYYKLREMF